MSVIFTLARSNVRILRRQPGYWIISLGLSATIILVYGSLFSDLTAPTLGLVVEQTSPQLDSAIRELEQNDEITLDRGEREDELQALRDGERWAVLVIGDGAIDATSRDPRQVQLFYNNQNPFEGTTGRGLFREFVARLNESFKTGNDSLGKVTIEAHATDARTPPRLIDLLFPGIVGMAIMFSNSWAAGTIVWWRQTGVLRRIGLSPVHPLALEISQLIAFGFLSAVQIAILFTLGRLLFNVEVAGSYLSLIAVLTLGVLSFMGVWYTFAALIPSTVTFFSLLNLTAFVMMFLGGSVLPIEDAPTWLQPLIQMLPLTHLNEALRGVINRGDALDSLLTHVFVLSAWVVIGFGASVRIFRWGRE